MQNHRRWASPTLPRVSSGSPTTISIFSHRLYKRLIHAASGVLRATLHTESAYRPPRIKCQFLGTRLQVRVDEIVVTTAEQT